MEVKLQGELSEESWAYLCVFEKSEKLDSKKLNLTLISKEKL